MWLLLKPPRSKRSRSWKRLRQSGSISPRLFFSFTGLTRAAKGARSSPRGQAALLAHADPRTTEKVYTHAGAKVLTGEVNVIDEELRGGVT